MGNILKEQVKNFLKKPELRYPNNYQTIELPFGHVLHSYNSNYEYMSWYMIQNIIDYKNKRVADIGSNNGFFCFKIKEKGASSVDGFDKNGECIEIAKEAAYLKNLDVNFKVLDIEKQEIGNYDIILFMNISHHLKNPEKAFNKIFSKAENVILEVHLKKEKPTWIHTPYWNIVNKERIIEIAGKYNHKLIKEIESARPDRVIMLFEKWKK